MGEVYGSGQINSTAYNQFLYAGSPFLTFPVWQKGRFQLDKLGKSVSAEMAYNLVTNEVLCRFPGDSVGKIIAPETFTILDTQFFRPQANSKYRSYFTILHNGPTKLLKTFTGRLDSKNSPETTRNGYDLDASVSGTFRIITEYYIQKGEAKPELIRLASNSVLNVLYEQADKLAAMLPAKKLTVEDVEKAIIAYDNLMDNRVESQTTTPLFTQLLHDKISYPGDAWTKGIYSRVYAGFDIDPQGNMKNIVILSPENVGLGFIESVKNGLEKIPALDPTLSGKYAIPIAFTYTNTKESTETHTPINRLPENRLDGRTMLDEVIVPIVVKKPVTTSREVWGYYK
ncbi:hypothetical protein GCM10028805_48870 [Spirosoma harenae]